MFESGSYIHAVAEDAEPLEPLKPMRNRLHIDHSTTEDHHADPNKSSKHCTNSVLPCRSAKHQGHSGTWETRQNDVQQVEQKLINCQLEPCWKTTKHISVTRVSVSVISNVDSQHSYFTCWQPTLENQSNSRASNCLRIVCSLMNSVVKWTLAPLTLTYWQHSHELQVIKRH